VLALLAVAACGPRVPVATLVRLEVSRDADSTRLRVVPAPGVRINAGAPPALEGADGAVTRFAGERDPSAPDYFAAPPRAALPAGRAVRGRLVASVCPAGARACRVVTVPVDGG
jgi:hypothetical protein